MSLLVSAVVQGILWSVVSLGLFITFRILNIADMTTEGSFPLGATVAVQAIIHGYSPIIALVLAFMSGLLAGALTGFLIAICRIPSLLAGILSMTALYSINLRVLNRPNQNLLSHRTIIDLVSDSPDFKQYASLWVGILLTLVVVVGMDWFFKTELGQAIIATGDNNRMARSFGVDTKKMTVIGIMLANGLISMGGGLIAQYNGYADVNMGIGTIVVGLAAIIIGEILFQNVSFIIRLTCVIVGAIIYRLLLVVVITSDILEANDFKLFSALIIAVCLTLPTISQKLHLPQLFRKSGDK